MGQGGLQALQQGIRRAGVSQGGLELALAARAQREGLWAGPLRGLGGLEGFQEAIEQGGWLGAGFGGMRFWLRQFSLCGLLLRCRV
jgi:hypothetical protein